MARLAQALGVTVALVGAAIEGMAQQPDTIRGRVVDSDSKPVAYATVVATSLRLDTWRSAVTDDSGRYSIVFPQPSAPYLVRVIVLGHEAEQLEVRRQDAAALLQVDIRLPYAVRPLDRVVVTFRPPRPRPSRDENVIATVRSDDTVNVETVTYEQAGNLAALAAALPGMQLVPGRDGDPDSFSALGLPPDQNRTTLNGIGTTVTRLPRDANVSVSVATTPYDVSRGGFSGAEVRVVTRPGTNFSSRTMSANLITPYLQWTDRAARGQQYTNVSLGGAASGPLVFDKTYYNVSWQLGRRLNDLKSVVNSGAGELQSAGVSSDSIARLMQLLSAAGIPVVVDGVPENRTIDQASVLGAFDIAPPSPTSGHAYNVTASGDWTHSMPVSTSLLTAFPAHDGTRTSLGGSLQGRHTNYFGPSILTETSLGISATKNVTEPYIDVPHGGVRINSSFPDGTSAVRTVAFGGSPSLTSRSTAATTTLMNRLTWLDRNSTHRFALTSEFRYERFEQSVRTNHLGSFSYNSLADLEAGRASSFTRQLTPHRTSGRQLVAGLSLGDSWQRTPDFHLQYGVRLDANRYLNNPETNPAIRVVYGLPNDGVPNRAYLSPRAGFAWTYGTAAQYRGAQASGRSPRPSLRGGAGLFQNTPPMNLLASAEQNTGLPSAVQQLRCVGVATPEAAWRDYIADPSTIPPECQDGTGASVFASSTPNVYLFNPDYAMRRSVRANLQWSGPVLDNRFVVTANTTLSLNLDQPGNTDANFNATPRFTLDDEGGRPVYVPTTSVVSGTGSVGAREARLAQEFARVWQQLSDLQSATQQLNISLRPLSLARTNFGWNASYVLQDVRDELWGFSNTVDNPFGRDRARASSARHQISYSLSYNLLDWVHFSWSGRFQSGARFTPMVAGDVNGDGSSSNDRAFVFEPAAFADSANQERMRALLESGSRAARACLGGQLGRLAARNSCTGPWLASASLSMSVNAVKLGLPPRASLSFQVSNPLGALDLLLNGHRNLRGWGQPESPEATLLYVRGFDRDEQRFRYEVNERFAATRPREKIVRSPVMITALLRLDVGAPRQRQNLAQQLDRGRTRPGNRVAENTLRGLGRNAVPNPMSRILQQRDSLGLAAEPADSLTALERAFTARLDAIWNPVGAYLASLPEDYNEQEAYRRYRQAREASIDYLLELVPAVRTLLTPAQLKQLPAAITNLLDSRYLRSIRSSAG